MPESFFMVYPEVVHEMNKLTDKELLEGFTVDKEKAFRSFFDAYYIRLCAYAVQITDDFFESEDIVQRFFIKFWEKELYKDVTMNLKNYAYLCVRNDSLKYLNKKEQIPIDARYWGEEYLYDLDEMDEQERECKEQELRIALDALSAQERNALRLVVLENKKYKEAADELGISINSLKTYLSRALKHLRKNNKLMLLLLFVSDRSGDFF